MIRGPGEHSNMRESEAIWTKVNKFPVINDKIHKGNDSCQNDENIFNRKSKRLIFKFYKGSIQINTKTQPSRRESKNMDCRFTEREMK